MRRYSKACPVPPPSVLLLVVMMTRYLDTLKDLGSNSRSITLLIPHTPAEWLKRS